MSTTPKPQFKIGQTVYFPLLNLTEEGDVRKCEVREGYVVGKYENHLHEHGLGFTVCEKAYKNWKVMNPDDLHLTTHEAKIKLVEKVNARIAKLTDALNKIS